MQARYYDPVIGRFYSNDPIGFRDVHSFNRYAYGNNNPYKFLDPTGQSSEYSFKSFSTMLANSFGFKSAPEGNAKIGKVAKQVTVNSLRTAGQGADLASKTALGVAASGAMTGNIPLAEAGATASTVAGLVSAAADGLADVIEGGSLSGETIESASPMMAGQAADTGLKAAKVVTQISKPVAIAVEVVATIAETVGDVVEQHEKEN